ncbi:MAG TPA: hypothetical protein DD670_07125, partial [Planctomycetaceae bacterium]|nr:hypothetical protein [Planctomycetaceae bacterium]
MKRFETLSGCACCPVHRRRFLATGCAACAGAASLVGVGRLAHAAEKTDKTRIRVIYALHAEVQPGADWPNVGFDFRPVMARIDAALKQGCPGFEFVTSMAKTPQDAQKILDEDQSAAIDGYLVYQMNCWNRVVQPVLATNKPTLYADFQYGGSGGYLVYTAGFLRDKRPNVGLVASSDPDDLITAVKCFDIVKKGGTVEDFAAATARVRKSRTPAASGMACEPDRLELLDTKDWHAAMKRAKILTVGGGFPNIVPAIVKEMGIEVEDVPYAELNAAWEAADKDQANEIADRWQKTAKKIEDVSRKTLEESAAMYLAQKEVLKKRNANAITINCLG